MTTIFGRYKIGDMIGSGSFGNVYIGTSLRTNDKVAIKADEKHGNDTTLSHEAKILNYLRGPSYIPVLRYYGSIIETNTNYLVMNLLGKSLETIKYERRRVNSQDAIDIGIQSIKMLRYIHGKSIIHRDIKPENFLFGLDSKHKQLNIIDFGLAKKVVDSNYNHIKERNDRPTVGTMRYISPNVQNGKEASRRDDMISLAYMLIYLQIEKLPWQGINKPLIEKDAEICRIKKQISSTTLCNGLSDCFAQLLFHAKNLKFDQEPSYGRMEKRFTDAMKSRD
jgi:serine/threonine protein kinase